MNRNVERLIPKALISAEKHLATDGVIPKEYNGYISSFGAAILQSGLKAAVAFNENSNSSSQQDRRPLMRAILEIISNKEIDQNSQERLLDYVLKNDSVALKNKIIDAATALKLAIRTFKLTGEDE